MRRRVAGVAMGLVLNEDGSFIILSDIMGMEDHLGDMDFKVAGDADTITAFQMDIKVEGVTVEILRKALESARESRRHILGEMEKSQPPPRAKLSPFCQRILTFDVPNDKVGQVIGPGGAFTSLALCDHIPLCWTSSQDKDEFSAAAAAAAAATRALWI
jgi:polyribonucleotide nucleotidyltransferase